jgi:hypothetical protein
MLITIMKQLLFVLSRKSEFAYLAYDFLALVSLSIYTCLNSLGSELIFITNKSPFYPCT